MRRNGISRIFQEILVFLLFRSQIQVDQISWCMVSYRIPILAHPVRAEARAIRAKQYRVDMRIITFALLIFEEAFKEVNRQFRIAQNRRITIHAVRLDRTCQSVNLFIHRNGIVIISEFRGKDFLFLISIDINAMIPIHHILVHIIETHVLLQVFHALLGRLQEDIFTRQHECGCHTINHTRNGIRLLAERVHFPFSTQANRCTVLFVINIAIAKLSAYKEITNALRLVNPPIRFLEAELAQLPFREVDLLRFKRIFTILLRIKNTEDESHTPVLCQQRIHISRRILVWFIQITKQTGKSRIGQSHRKRTSIRRSQRKALLSFVEITYISSHQICKFKLHFPCRFEYLKIVVHNRIILLLLLILKLSCVLCQKYSYNPERFPLCFQTILVIFPTDYNYVSEGSSQRLKRLFILFFI